MTTEATPRLTLPFIQPGQAQKEMFHNEALARLDLIVQAAAEAIGETVPPTGPVEGQAWIVGAGATGEWAGADNQLAGWSNNGWRFVMPRAGMCVWLGQTTGFAVYDGAEWRVGDLVGQRVSIEGVQVVGNQSAAIADPEGGATMDVQARDAINAILGAMRHHGLIASG